MTMRHGIHNIKLVENPNRGCSYFPHRFFGAYMDILFTIKVNTSRVPYYKSPPHTMMLTIEFRMVIIAVYDWGEPASNYR